MSTVHNPIRLFETVIDDCPYIENERSSSILVDPDHRIDTHLFSLLSRSGFRRSGEMLYTPKCPSCKACISVRIPAAKFIPSRGQRRVWRKNSDITVKVTDVSFQQEHFDLYLKYQRARHPDSTMCDEDPEKYISFINSKYSESRFLCMYQENQLIGISVIDQFEGGVSAVYTFFDPEQSKRSLGTYIIMYMIKIARLQNVPYVYLGYWVDQSRKMDYKRSFKPLQGYINRNWVDLEF